MHLGNILDIIMGNIEALRVTSEAIRAGAWATGAWMRRNRASMTFEFIPFFVCLYCCESYFDFYSS